MSFRCSACTEVRSRVLDCQRCFRSYHQDCGAFRDIRIKLNPVRCCSNCQVELGARKHFYVDVSVDNSRQLPTIHESHSDIPLQDIIVQTNVNNLGAETSDQNIVKINTDIDLVETLKSINASIACLPATQQNLKDLQSLNSSFNELSGKIDVMIQDTKMLKKD